MDKQNVSERKDIMFIIGIFFAIFAVTIFIAVFFTESERGKIVNIICSGIFVVSSVVSFLISKRKQNKRT